jgi:uncharacterized protein (TIGR03437 family)
MLSSGQTLSLDTGTVASSGGDILWTGSSITFQGSATGFNLSADGLTGASDLSILTQSTLAGLSFGFSSASLPLSALAVNNIFAVHTNGGNYAAVLVTAQSGTSITLQFISYVSTVPTITQVINNYSLIPAGFVNSGIAPGALFIIKGALLASATSVSALNSSAAPGLPTTFNGSTVNVTVNGTTTHPAFYYAENIQLAVVMPSNTPVGAGTVTVTYNGQTSAPFNINVVASAFGFGAYYGTGSGLGLATNASNYALYSYTNSIVPGTTIVLYGSGLGADAARDTVYTPVAFSIPGLAHIYIGGIDAAIFYQGASGYPGLNEIDVTVPSNVTPGCGVSVVGVSAAGVPTNFITLAIGAEGGICQDPQGYNGTQITSQIQETNYSYGAVELFQNTSPATNGPGTTTTQEASAVFESYSGSATTSVSGFVSYPGCIVYEAASSTSGSFTTTGLNAGTITVSGPSGSDTLTNFASLSNMPYYVGVYESADSTGNSTLPAGFIPPTGGTFTFTGSGGTTSPSVGPFSVQIVFPNPLLQWTNQAAAATVTRSAGQLITWTSGSPGTYVSMSGFASSASISGNFTCVAPVADLQFTIPSYVLAALPASTTGSLSVGNSTVPQAFSATGINNGTAIGGVSYTISATYK